MTEPSPLWPLPGIADWSFSDVADQDPARAEQLARAGQPPALIDAASRALAGGAETGAVLFGWEFAEKQPSHHRAVVQFRVDAALFDWFFNARTGYRAHYRAHPDQGLAFNARLVHALRDQLRQDLPSMLHIARVDSGMNPHGGVSVPRDDFIRSLHPDLAKLWIGATPVGGGDIRTVGLTGPRIRVGSTTWAAPYMDDAWLDLKGAFDDNGRLYQPKSPALRAVRLHETGEA